MNSSVDETKELVNKQKLNIFDEQESSMLKHETLARLGFEDKALALDMSRSVSSKSSSVALPDT